MSEIELTDQRAPLRQQHVRAAQQAVHREVVVERVIIVEVVPCSISVRQKEKTHEVPHEFQGQLRAFREVLK